jgi:hypothetical protein
MRAFKVSPISSVSPVEDLEDLGEMTTLLLEKRQRLRGVVDEVAKKASTLTANGDPRRGA